MNETRPVTVRIGEAEEVTVPPGFAVPYSEAILHKQGEMLIIQPAKKSKGSLKELLAGWEPEDFPLVEDLPMDTPPDLG